MGPGRFVGGSHFSRFSCCLEVLIGFANGSEVHGHPGARFLQGGLAPVARGLQPLEGSQAHSPGLPKPKRLRQPRGMWHQEQHLAGSFPLMRVSSNIFSNVFAVV